MSGLISRDRLETALRGLRARVSARGASPEPTLSAEQEAAFDASALPEALVERGGEVPIGEAAPPSPLPVAPTPATAAGTAAAQTPPAKRAAALSDRIHDWLPLAIVAVSVLAALMGWRASLSDESAGHKDELARQDLVTQQEVLLQKIQGVDSDIRLFGPFEQYSLLGEALVKDSAGVGGAERQSLARQGQGDVEIAREIGGQFRYSSDYAPSAPSNYYSSKNTTGSLQPDGSYRPGNPYRVAIEITGAQSGDTQLTSLEPDHLRAQAKAERLKGVQLIGLAALFIAGLVFFTLAAVSRGLRTTWLAVCGVAVGLIGLVLFPVVQLS